MTALVAGIGLVGTGSNPALAEPQDQKEVLATGVDVYTTPGEHEINGRRWRTTCDMYSTTVERCTANIWATQVRFVGGAYQEVTGWFFNNLTYKPSPREQWNGNPLAANGAVGGKSSWTSDEGRQWKTECDTAETGRNGCRSYIMSKDIVVKTLTPRTYERVDRWVFNNVVQFTVPKPVEPPPVPKVWCDNAPLPHRMALRNADGLPYYTDAPYTPRDVYNPNTIANFIKNVSRDSRLSETQESCLANLAGKHLIDGSHTEGTGNDTVRWFGYRFDFSANPGIPDLSGEGDGWFSGLAQGGVLSAFVEMDRITGDQKWMEYGKQAFRSFDVPMKPDGSGGITNRITVDGNEVLWFEEYPTSPATSVLNGHLEALIGLDIWFNATHDQHAKDLVNVALDGLEPVLEQEQIAVQGGTLTSYDMVRGYTDVGRDYKASELRLYSPNGDATVRPATLLNGSPVTIPHITTPQPRKGNRLYDSKMAGPILAYKTMPQQGWQQITSSKSAKPELVNQQIVASTDGEGWQGVSQVVPAGVLQPGRKLTLGLDAKLQTPVSGGPGSSGKVAVYKQCSGTTELIFESQKMRSSQMTSYTFSFQAPPAGCNTLLQLTHSSYGNIGTKITYDNVSLQEADDLGASSKYFQTKPAADPFQHFSQFVYEQPINTLTLSGNGPVELQAYEDGRWQTFDTVTLEAGQATTAVIPERVTGRNIHYGYHEHHVEELVSLYNRTKDDIGKEREFLRGYAASWVRMAPAKQGLVPPPPNANARVMSEPDPGDTYDIEVIDPFSLLEEE